MLVGPGGSAAKAWAQEQKRKLQEQEFAVDEGIDDRFPPTRLPVVMLREPVIIRCPMTRFIDFDDPKCLHQARVLADDRMTQKSLHLAITALFRQRNYPAQPREQP